MLSQLLCPILLGGPELLQSGVQQGEAREKSADRDWVVQTVVGPFAYRLRINCGQVLQERGKS